MIRHDTTEVLIEYLWQDKEKDDQQKHDMNRALGCSVSCAMPFWKRLMHLGATLLHAPMNASWSSLQFYGMSCRVTTLQVEGKHELSEAIRNLLGGSSGNKLDFSSFALGQRCEKLWNGGSCVGNLFNTSSPPSIKIVTWLPYCWK